MTAQRQFRSSGPAVVGVDIGGTFTDFVVVRDGFVTVYKVPSTPADPSEAFLRGLDELEITALTRLVHGSTVATNAVLERRGARAALLTTAGFRDVLELGRQTRLQLYALHPRKPEPLIPREWCFEVPERVDSAGNVLEPLCPDAVEQVLDQIVASGVEALAVVFLFSFAHDAHERLVGEQAARRGLSVSLSSEILPEYREYERASTTAANAYVAPLMDRYLRRLDQRLRERAARLSGGDDGEADYGRLQIMQSNGGVISVAVARREAVRTVLSGPAGGVMGAWRLAAQAGFPRLITFDMGGTSTDVALVDGEPRTSTDGSINDLPIRVPMLDIHTVGAGGGSIARLDTGGGLRVGPESAGSDPGPACYGRGTQPVVTDANLLLGRLRSETFLGGRMALDVTRSQDAVAILAQGLGLSCEDAAEGIIRVANVQMARALRRVSVERGYDPREFCLVAFGGGGPLHACDLAEETGIPTVLIPRYPGALSALGMLLSDIRKEYSRTVMRPVTADLPDLERVFDELEAQATAEMREEGVGPETLRLERILDARYRGQSYELPLSVAAGAEQLLPQVVAAAFHAAHQRRYGYAAADTACEVVNVRLKASGAVPALPLPYREPEPDVSRPEPTGRQRVFQSGAWTEAGIYARESLVPGQRVDGPALICQSDTTVWLPPSWSAVVDGWYNLIASRE